MICLQYLILSFNVRIILMAFMATSLNCHAAPIRNPVIGYVLVQRIGCIKPITFQDIAHDFVVRGSLQDGGRFSVTFVRSFEYSSYFLPNTWAINWILVFVSIWNGYFGIYMHSK